MNRIPELDGVRALAIALVIGCNYPVFAGLFGGLPQFGWAGVEIFFVLSGYLITTILLGLRGRPHAYRIFYARRARRIFPPYFITVVLAALFNLGFTLRPDFRTLLLQASILNSFPHSPTIFLDALRALHHHAAPSLFAAVHLPLGQQGADPYRFKDALSHTWSLSVEGWFYILWAPTVLAFGRRGIALGALAALLLGFVLRWAGGVSGLTWYMNFFCRFDLLGIGALLALWLDRRRHLALPRRRIGDFFLAGIALGAITGLAAILFRIRPFLGREIRNAPLFAAFGTPLIGLAVAGLIAHLIHSSRGRSPLAYLFRLPPLVWIGRRSYTIYLAHLPWYWVVCAFLGTAGRGTWTAALVSLALTLATAAFSWHYFEEPLLRPRTEPLITDSR